VDHEIALSEVGSRVVDVMPELELTGQPADFLVPEAADLFRRGRFAAAERRLRCEIGRFRRRGQLGRAGGVSVELGYQQLLRGRVSEALTSAFEARDLCLAADRPCGVVAGQLLAGWSLFDADRFGEAEQAFRSGLEGARALAHIDGVRAASVSMASLLIATRRMGEASAAIAAPPPEGANSWRTADAVADRPIGQRCVADADGGLPRLLPRPQKLLSAEARIRLALDGGDVGLAESVFANARDGARWSCGIDRAAVSICEMLVRGAQGLAADVTQACAAGLRGARAAHAPAMALELRLVYSQVLLQAGRHRDAARVVERLRRSSWPAPSRLRRCLGELADRLGHSPRRTQQASGDSTVQVNAVDVLAILQACGEGQDDRQAVSGVCHALRTSLHATAVAVFGANGRPAPFACAGSRSFSGDIIARTLASGRSSASDDVAVAGEAAVPITSGTAILGVVVAKWATASDCVFPKHLALLRSAASAVAPAVRVLAGDETDAAQPAGVLGEISGSSRAVIELRHSVVGAASAPFPVLIQGESGSGKELVAKAIHAASARRARRFCAVNCAALPDELCEAELFGHARGAFTGAATERAGLFEEADGGTLFLDEVGELSLRAQAKLLRVIQEGEVRRLGENAHRRVDSRIVAASNRSLRTEVDAGRFRHDLLFRLDVIQIRVPPLRERREDIPCLVAQIWKNARERLGSRAELSSSTIEALAGYLWPGNVRELQNVLCALAASAPRCGRLGPDRLPRHIMVIPITVVDAPTLEDGRREFERRFVREALVRAGGRPTRAAEQLGVTRQGLAKLLARLEIRS
jgi:DNA-binding NtrC family response regulator